MEQLKKWVVVETRGGQISGWAEHWQAEQERRREEERQREAMAEHVLRGQRIA